MHVASSAPRKLVLPSIGPLFATSTSTHHSTNQHGHGSSLPPPRALLTTSTMNNRDADSTRYLPPHPVNLRTPTGVHAVPSFDRAFATSSPVHKKPHTMKGLTALEGFMLDGSLSPTDVAGAMAEGEEKLRLSRERNRLHAQRTRIRKRELLESLKERIITLQHDYALLKQAYESHVTAMCLLGLGDSEAHHTLHGLEDISDLTKGIDIQQSISVNDEDVDAAAAASGQTALILHDKTCPYYHMDPEDDGSGSEDFACVCLDRGSDLNANGKRPHPGIPMCSKQEREQIRRERNRLHARRARLRKKLMLEKSQQAVQDLRTRNDALRTRLAVLITAIYENRPGVMAQSA